MPPARVAFALSAARLCPACLPSDRRVCLFSFCAGLNDSTHRNLDSGWFYLLGTESQRDEIDPL